MQIAARKVVSLHYTLRGEEGDLIDQATPEEPFFYIHGVGNIIPGLEKALDGKSAGDKLSVSIPPEDAYGLHDKEQVQIAPRSAFYGVTDIKPGMQFQAETESGHYQLVTVQAVDGDQVILDSNHPLAGQTLNFDVEVVSIRDASAEELDHGHVHGPEGHHH
ncbi:MAG: peptidylprolyl isomerase [Methylococcaceae bacterium]|nr:MAG: peptidylprolyl isomerase [Methylococcaceae bacterium]